ncbi:hypothetical protein ScPMuIL_001557 [Solemya velum]
MFVSVRRGPLDASVHLLGCMCIHVHMIALILLVSLKYVAGKIPPGYQVIHPIFVTEDGEFISHVHFHHRIKRDVKLHQPDLYLNVTAFDKDLNMKLTPNTHLLAPGFTVYHRHRQNTSHPLTTDSESHMTA